MFKFNNENGIEERQWRRSGVFIVNFAHISRLLLVFLLSIFKKWMLARLCFKKIKNN